MRCGDARNRSTSTSSSACSTSATRDAIRQNLAGFGNALAGRGPQLNEAFGALRRPVVNGQPAAGDDRRPAAPTSPASGGRWRPSRRRSPRSPRRSASLFVGARPDLRRLRPRLAALHPGNDREGSRRPWTRPTPTCPSSTRSCATPAASSPLCKPGARALGETSPIIAEALHAGVPALNASPVLNAQLPPTAEALVDFQESPGVFNGLDLLIDTNEILEPSLRFIAPAQTTCNYVSARLPNLALSTTGGNDAGKWLNFVAFSTAGRCQQRGQPGGRAGQRTRHPQPPALQPLPEHRCARPDARLRSRQREVLHRQDRDRPRRRKSSAKPPAGRLKNEPPAGARQPRGSDQEAALQLAAQQHRDRDRLHPDLHDRALPGLHQTRARSPATATKSSATFANSANIALNSPVRIAGVEVGKVISTERDGDATTVTFTVDDAGRPIHDDAFAAIRPRIFLEGNFFVELDPGSPSAPEHGQRRHDPDQPHLDRGPARRNPHRPAVAGRGPTSAACCEGYGTALNDKPTAAEDTDQLPRGAGAQRRRSAERRLQIRRRRGPLQRPGDRRPARHPAGDLSRLVSGAGRTFGAFASREADLQGLITTSTSSPAPWPTQSTNLATTVQLLAPTLQRRPHLADQPQPHAAAAAHLRDRADPGGSRAAGLDQRLETVARPGPAAARRAKRAAASPSC